MTTLLGPWRRRLMLSGPLLDILVLTLLVWAGFLLTVAAVAVGIAIFGDIDASVLEPASQIARWYVIFIGGYISHDVLALHVTHGQTRRAFAERAVVFLGVLCAVVAVLMAVGYVLERGLYRLAGWPHRLSNDHFYASPVQVPAVFVEFWLVMLVWAAAGAFIGAAFYRYEADGWVAIMAALVPIALADIAFGRGWGPVGALLERFGDVGSPPVAVSILLCLVGAAASLAMAWPIVRDVPIRNKSA